MPKRPVKADTVLEDIRSGMLYSQLLRRHQLTPQEFRSVFRRLIVEKNLSASDLKGESSSEAPDAYDDSIFDAQSRRFERRHIDFPLPAYDSDNPLIIGYIVNLSRWGMKIRGVECDVGEVRGFITPSHKTYYLEPVQFEAVCRWKSNRVLHQTPTAGFEVLAFHIGSFEILQRNIESLSESERSSITENDWRGV